MDIECVEFRSRKTDQETVRAMKIYAPENFAAILDWVEEMGLAYDKNRPRKYIWVLPREYE